MRNYSKYIKNRAKNRKGYSEFYEKHVAIIRGEGMKCQECGCKLLGDVSEVAHVLPKQSFKSVSTNDDNIIYLCGYRQNNCHGKYDSTWKEAKTMKVWGLAYEQYLKFKRYIKETHKFKTLNHFEEYGESKGPVEET